MVPPSLPWQPTSDCCTLLSSNRILKLPGSQTAEIMWLSAARGWRASFQAMGKRKWFSFGDVKYQTVVLHKRRSLIWAQCLDDVDAAKHVGGKWSSPHFAFLRWRNKRSLCGDWCEDKKLPGVPPLEPLIENLKHTHPAARLWRRDSREAQSYPERRGAAVPLLGQSTTGDRLHLGSVYTVAWVMCAVSSTYLWLTFTTARLLFTVSASAQQAPGFFYCQRQCGPPSPNLAGVHWASYILVPRDASRSFCIVTSFIYSAGQQSMLEIKPSTCTLRRRLQHFLTARGQ